MFRFNKKVLLFKSTCTTRNVILIFMNCIFGAAAYIFKLLKIKTLFIYLFIKMKI